MKTSADFHFRKDINGLRAIALISVVLYHFGIAGTSGGFTGVDVFFVISGYLMTQIIVSRMETGTFSILGFFSARARRLVPALAVLCLSMMALGWLFVDPVSYQMLSKDTVSALLFVSNFLFWQESNYFAAESGTRWLLHTWSLSVEWQFYLAYPLVLVGLVRFLKLGKWLVPLLVAAFLVSLLISFILTPVSAKSAFYMLPARAWEMLAGGLVFFAERCFQLRRQTAVALEVLGLALVVGSVLLLDDSYPWPGLWAVLPVLGAALVLFSRSQTIVARLPGLQAVGAWSYSLYLWHWPILVAIRYFELPLDFVSVAGGMLLTLLLGYASYRLVETPVRLSKPAGWHRPARLAVWLCLLAVSGLGILTHGFTQRSANPVQMASAAAAAADWNFPPDCGINNSGTLSPCTLGGASTGGTLVIGDSHAEQWYPRARALAGANDRVVFATSKGCLPLPQVRNVGPGADCAMVFSKARDLLMSGSFDRVVIGGIWNIEAPATGHSRFCLVENGQCTPKAGDRAVIEASLALLAPILLQARELGTEAVILLPIPYGKTNIPRAIAKRQFVTWLPSPEQPLAKAAILAKDDWIRTQLVKLANDASGISVDPLDVLCDAVDCPVVNAAGESLYMDHNHLRSSIVASTASFMDPYLLGH